MIDEALAKLIEFIESASPVIWQAAIQQVRGNIMSTWIWLGLAAVILLGAIVFLVYACRRYAADRPYGEWGMGVVAAVMFLLCALGIFGAILTEQIKMINNPAWYAIRQLRGLLP